MKQIYKDKGYYKDIVDIYGILAAEAISVQNNDTSQDAATIAAAYKKISTWLNQSESINKQNEYIFLVAGYFQILRGSIYMFQAVYLLTISCCRAN